MSQIENNNSSMENTNPSNEIREVSNTRKITVIDPNFNGDNASASVVEMKPSDNGTVTWGDLIDHLINHEDKNHLNSTFNYSIAYMGEGGTIKHEDINYHSRNTVIPESSKVNLYITPGKVNSGAWDMDNLPTPTEVKNLRRNDFIGLLKFLKNENPTLFLRFFNNAYSSLPTQYLNERWELFFQSSDFPTSNVTTTSSSTVSTSTRNENPIYQHPFYLKLKQELNDKVQALVNRIQESSSDIDESLSDAMSKVMDNVREVENNLEDAHTFKCNQKNASPDEMNNLTRSINTSESKLENMIHHILNEISKINDAIDNLNMTTSHLLRK